MKNLKNKNIIYFDGDCGLCDFFVQYIYTRDRNKTFYYAPLQGKTATSNLPKEYTRVLKTLVLWQKKDAQREHLSIKSTAALKILSQLPYHSLIKILWIIPRSIRDFFYDVISKQRKKLFPSRSCKWKQEFNEKLLD